MTWSAKFSSVTSILDAAAAVRARVSSATIQPRAGPAVSRTSNKGDAPKNWNVEGSHNEVSDEILAGSGTVKAVCVLNARLQMDRNVGSCRTRGWSPLCAMTQR